MTGTTGGISCKLRVIDNQDNIGTESVVGKAEMYKDLDLLGGWGMGRHEEIQPTEQRDAQKRSDGAG